MSEEKKDLNDIEEMNDETLAETVGEIPEETEYEAWEAEEQNKSTPKGANYPPEEPECEDDDEEIEVPKSFFKRLFSNPIFSCVLLLLLVAGCAFSIYWNIFREEPPVEAKPESVIATVGEQKIYAYEISAYCKIGMDVDQAIEYLTEEKHYLNLAKEKKISLSAEETSSIEQGILEMGESFAVQAVQFGLTTYQYKQIIINGELAQKVRTQLPTLGLKGFTEKDQKKFYNDKFLRAKHVLIPFTAGNTASEEAALKTATKVAERLNNGEDIDTLIEAYPNDPGSAYYPDGYVFLDHTKLKLTDDLKASLASESVIMADAFTEATAKLDIGAVSEPVKTEHGYHVIVRLDLNETEEMFTDNQFLVFNVMRAVNESAFKKSIEKNQIIIDEKLRDNLIIKTYREEHAETTQPMYGY